MSQQTASNLLIISFKFCRFLVVLTVSKSKCLDRRNGNSENFDNYFWYIFIIQVDIEAVKPISQKGNNLFSEAHALSNLKLHTCTSPPQGPLPSQDSTWPSWGWPEHIAGDGKDLLRFRWSSWHWEDHLDELVKKELTLVMLPPFQWWFVGVTFS